MYFLFGRILKYLLGQKTEYVQKTTLFKFSWVMASPFRTDKLLPGTQSEKRLGGSKKGYHYEYIT